MDIYSLSDSVIRQRMGDKIKKMRLRQNITQADLADEAQISLSSVKKIENGEIGTFDTLLRILRVLGSLDSLQTLVREDEMSPNEYYEFVNSAKRKIRKRAVSRNNNDRHKTESEW